MCPVRHAGRGVWVRREDARKRTFYGCSNSYCKHTQAPCPACGTGLPIQEADKGLRCRDCKLSLEACPVCDGWLQRRFGRHGPFIGCSKYPACKYTRNVTEHRRRRGDVAGSV